MNVRVTISGRIVGKDGEAGSSCSGVKEDRPAHAMTFRSIGRCATRTARAARTASGFVACEGDVSEGQ